jgi:hypothetical protein
MSKGDKVHSEARGISFGYVIYQQVAGVLGAFALAAFLGHFVHLDWRGALADLIGLWGQYVRPVVKLFFEITVVAFVKWAFNWRIEVPLLVRDYFSVGAVLLLSTLRAMFFVPLLSRFTSGNRVTARISNLFLSGMSPLYVFFATVLFWPYMLIRYVMHLLRIKRLAAVDLDSLEEIIGVDYFLEGGTGTPIFVTEVNRKAWATRDIALLLAVSPIIYLALLLVTNYLLLKPGS